MRFTPAFAELPYLFPPWGNLELAPVIDLTADTARQRDKIHHEKAGWGLGWRETIFFEIAIGPWRCDRPCRCWSLWILLAKKHPMERTSMKTNKVMYYATWFVPMLAHENIQARAVCMITSLSQAPWRSVMRKFSCSHSAEQRSQRAWEDQRQGK